AAGVANVAAGSVEVDRIADDVDRVQADAAVATIDDRAVRRGQRDVARGVDRADFEVAGGFRAEQGGQFSAGRRLVAEDAEGGCRGGVARGQDAEVEAGAVLDIDVDLKEVSGQADAAGDAGETRGHGDVDAGDVGVGADAVVDGVQDGPRREQGDVV